MKYGIVELDGGGVCVCVRMCMCVSQCVYVYVSQCVYVYVSQCWVLDVCVCNYHPLSQSIDGVFKRGLRQ